MMLTSSYPSLSRRSEPNKLPFDPLHYPYVSTNSDGPMKIFLKKGTKSQMSVAPFKESVSDSMHVKKYSIGR